MLVVSDETVVDSEVDEEALDDDGCVGTELHVVGMVGTPVLEELATPEHIVSIRPLRMA